METVKLEMKEGIALLTLDRPEVLNAINMQMLGELHEAMDEIEQTKDVRCVVLTGSGEKAFAAGADISEMENMHFADAKQFARKGYELCTRIAMLEMPTIAMIGGYALGGGLEIALFCDIRFAAEGAKVGLSEVTLGIMPGWGGARKLAEIAGYAFASQMVFSGKAISAEKAKRRNFINEVYSREELREATMRFARTVCGNAPLAVSSAKKSMNAENADGYDIENFYFAQLFLTKDQKLGMGNFNRKQKTERFTGEWL